MAPSDFDGDTPVQGGESPYPSIGLKSLYYAKATNIKSKPFGPTILAGKAAERFLRHMKEDKPNPLSIASLERGRKLIEEMERNGSVKIK